MSRDQFGLAIIEETGRCFASDREDIEQGCCWRYQLVSLPQVAGAVLKALDGTRPSTVEILPSTFEGAPYVCVKVGAWVNPFAPVQEGGYADGNSVLHYTIRYQEVGSVA